MTVTSLKCHINLSGGGKNTIYIHYSTVPILTSKLLIGLADMKMFFLSRLQDTIAGSVRYKELTMSACTAGGADAVNAMKGAFISARRLPISLNASLKPSPLFK